MVMFTCNNCGEALKKGVVDKHVFRCKAKYINVTCMDCLKDFDKDTYSDHNQCVTELERYSGKDYVPKANLNKGQKKQEAWIDLVRSITDKKKDISKGVANILNTISTHENVPRKKAKFFNFMKNSQRFARITELEEAWTLLEDAMKESKAENAAAAAQNGKQNGKQNVATNGATNEASNGVTNGETNGTTNVTTNGTSNGKRKLLVNEDPEEVESEPAKKKKKNEVDEPVTEESEKFSWSDTIRSILSAKNNELKLKKLRKKVVNKYQSLTGSEWSEKVENKFNKKINKLKGVVVDNEKVRLIE